MTPVTNVLGTLSTEANTAQCLTTNHNEQGYPSPGNPGFIKMKWLGFVVHLLEPIHKK